MIQSINIDRILRNDMEFAEISYNIENRYRCDWDDEIHDSFGRYVQAQKKASEDLHDIRESLYRMQIEVESMKIEALLAEIDDICLEARGL